MKKQKMFEKKKNRLKRYGVDQTTKPPQPLTKSPINHIVGINRMVSNLNGVYKWCL